MCTRSRKFKNGGQINMMYHNIKNKIVKNKFRKQWKISGHFLISLQFYGYILDLKLFS